MSSYIPDFTTVELDYVIEKNDVTSSYVDFIITGYSKKWKNFDISFEYKLLPDDIWLNDAVLSSADAYKIINNKIYNLNASESGTNNSLRWYYPSNYIPQGWSPQIRINIIPRLTSYSFSGTSSIEAISFGEGIVKYNKLGNNECLGKDFDGNYICINNNQVLIYQDPTIPPIKMYTATNPISHVISSLLGNYFIAIESSNMIIKTDNNFNIINIYYTNLPSFLDYSENNTLLITSTSGFSISEVRWTNIITPTWEYPNVFSTTPVSATYSIYQNNKILISTNGVSNSIIVYNRDNNTENIITAYYHRNNSKEIIKPYKAFYVNEYDIAIIEKDSEAIVGNHGIGWMIIGVNFTIS